MIRYPAYKDSGVEWIGEIPFSWTIKRLKYISDCNTSNVDKHSKDDENKVNLCNYTDVYKNDKIHSRMDFMSATASLSEIKKFQLKKDDVLITKDSETPDDIAIPALVTEDLNKILCGYHLAHIRSSDKYLIGTYLYYLFKSYRFNQQFTIAVNGITRFGLSIDDVRNAIISLPSTAEQSQIADFLDHKISQIDDLIAKKQKLIELLKEEHTALINQVVFKGLDPSVPMKDSGIEWLGEIPKHWHVTKLCYLTTRIGDGIHTTPEYVEKSEYAFINGNNLASGSIVLGESARYVQESEYLKHQRPLSNRTILMSINGTIGNLAFYRNEKVILGKSAAYINCREIINMRYLYSLFQSELMKFYFTSQLSGTTIFNLSLKTLNNTPIPLPPLEEQENIAIFIEDKYSQFESTISRIIKEIDLISEYKTSLINEAVTGKIDVRHK